MKTAKIFKVFQTLFKKKETGKTQTGREVGWMVGCKIKHRALLWLSLTKPRQFSFPRWSWVSLRTWEQSSCWGVDTHEKIF